MPTHEIKPQEFNIINDQYVIKTRCPREEITLPMIRTRVDRENVSVGAEIVVQCYDHEYETLYAEGRFYVTRRADSLRTREIDDVKSVSDILKDIGLQQRGNWWVTEEGKRHQAAIEKALEAYSEVA